MRSSWALLVGMAVLGACRDSSQAKTLPQPVSASESAPAAEDNPLDDDGCGAVTSASHPDPRSLLTEYLEHNGRGEFMATSAWHDGAVECPGHTPGWDGATLVTGWSTKPLDGGRDTARFLVSYVRFGRITQDSIGPYIAVDPATETDTLLFVRKSYGWRLGGFETDPHVLASGARPRLTLRPGDARLLDSLAALPVVGPRSGT
jgi:hypothetical protein